MTRTRSSIVPRRRRALAILAVVALATGCEAATPPAAPTTPRPLVDGNPKNGTSVDGLTVGDAAIDAVVLSPGR